MKIEGNGHLFDPNQRILRNDVQADAARTDGPNSSQARDRLEISAKSLELRRADLGSPNADQIRTERIAEISRRVETFTYTVNAEKVADAIISGALDDETT